MNPIKEVYRNYWLFPLHDFWTVLIEKSTNEVIKPNKKLNHLDVKEVGSFLALLLASTSNKLRLYFSSQTKAGGFDYNMTTEELATFGLTAPVNVGMWTSKPTAPPYTILLTPAYPMPYNGRLNIYAKNEDTVDVTLLTLQTARLYLKTL